jgi:hypothetical protein
VRTEVKALKIPWRRETAPTPSPDPDPSPDPGQVSPELRAWADALDVTMLSDKTAKTAERFLRDYRHMTSLIARRESALRLRAAIEAQVSPPPPATVSNMDVIATVISARRKILG